MAGITAEFAERVLGFDRAETARRIEDFMARTVSRVLRRRGVVVGVSGGVDSAVCVTLAVRALGRERVLALLMPERDSDPDGTRRALDLCRRLDIELVTEDIAAPLAELGCYRRRDEAIRRLFPEYGEGYRQKIVLSGSLLDNDRLSTFDLVIASPSGERQRAAMPLDVYLQVVAATNMKQRVRKLIEYYHAERMNYAVLGTPNRLEYELGFFVRGGDGLADLKPIAHLFKSQVYALAEHVGVPDEIRRQPPSTDTYSLEQTQEEFYFRLPYDRMDLMLFAYSHGVPAEVVAADVGLSGEQVERVYRDILGKRRMAARGLRDAILVEPVVVPIETGERAP